MYGLGRTVYQLKVWCWGVVCKGLGFRVEGGGALEFIVGGFEEALKIFTFRTPKV